MEPTSLELQFGLSGIGDVGQPSDRMCSLSRCTHALSEVLQSAAIDRSKFLELTNTIVDQARRSDSVDLRNPPFGALVAAEEALRHIYLPGSRERSILDLSGSDYKRAEFDKFSAWLAIQQRALRSLIRAASPTERADTNSVRSSESDCAPGGHVDVEELRIDHHGWGHRSIILIKNAHTYRPGELGQTANAALGALCGGTRSSSGDLVDFPWNEMAGGIQCAYEQVNQDDWTILHTKQRPLSSTEMLRYAQGIAKAIEADKCVTSGLRLLVVNFLQQK